MAKEKSCHKFIYKLSSKRLREAKWNLSLPLATAMKNSNDIVALNDSQILRWICELNGIEQLDEKVSGIMREIKRLKKQPKTRETQKQIKEWYQKVYALQYQKDYFCMMMDSNKDYDRANQGFQINGYPYHRLLGTNGGIKKSTIVYVGDHVYEEIRKRMDNGRDKNKPIIPAKLEAYQALICSGSLPVTMPRILIVRDCHVQFREDVIKISDEGEGEPILTEEKDYLVDYCDSDGYGLMSPAYSRQVNRDLYGESRDGQTITGVNTRYAWTKGMLFTFDFVEFAKRVNRGSYMARDAWGEWRDVRDYDVILTTSMVKLWDSYESLEHFIQCCNENHYQFSVSKATPHQLEHIRHANYQFLQTYDLTDEEIYQLCKPTIDEITGALGDDWRKTIVFLKGMFLEDDSVDRLENDFAKAIMIAPEMVQDPFVIKKIHDMIRKRIAMASKGSIKLSGNFAIVSGDLYSLAQSIFGLPVTGLLKAGEVYHPYWMRKGVDTIALFRAPMTCHNNIRLRKVATSEEMDFWYQYVTTGIILNSWDTTCDALNGADKDSDTFFTTDNPIIIKNTREEPTIECVQRKDHAIIPTEADMVRANKLAFGDAIGTTTNRITAMVERQAMFEKDSEEYRTLDYRIKCGQHFQQTAIDKAKGIIAKPMPKYWYSAKECQKLPEGTEEERHFKELCLRIVAEKKPYFLKYVYPDLMARWNKYQKDTNSKSIRMFQVPLSELLEKDEKTEDEQEFIQYYRKMMPAGDNPCTVNRIAWLFEHKFQPYLKEKTKNSHFDTAIIKSGVGYSKKDYQDIAKIKSEYDHAVKNFQQLAGRQRLDKEEVSMSRNMMLMHFQSRCQEICPNSSELCDILIDLCYSSSKSKQFVWDICGDAIIRNLLEKKSGAINYPLLVESQGEFEFGGEEFIMKQKKLLQGTATDNIKK
ncbi:MAG: hypothetical protein HFH62_14065 [Lachnospiraceae bacterium]|nr:hypothetical protein [Lachnospiraceae bacterium]